MGLSGSKVKNFNYKNNNNNKKYKESLSLDLTDKQYSPDTKNQNLDKNFILK